MRIDLIVACTKRKRGTPDAALCFRSMRATASTRHLAEEWLQHATRAPEERAVIDRYAGSDWAEVLRAYQSSRRLGACRLWVASAGFGLLSPADRIPSYSASFTPGPDRIAPRILSTAPVVARHQEWWAAVNTARGLGPTPLADREPIPCFAAVGEAYLAALTRDIVARIERHGADSLHVICVGAVRTRLPEPLRECLLPIDVRIERLLGGPRVTLNQRALAWLLSTAVPQVGWDRRAWHQLCIGALVGDRTVCRVAPTDPETGLDRAPEVRGSPCSARWL